jgi:hypothetical protein
MPYPHQSVLPALIALSGYAAALSAPELAVGESGCTIHSHTTREAAGARGQTM